MITVLDAYALTGYSRYDYLINDADLRQIVGKQFKTVGAALKAANDRCWIEVPGHKKARRHPFTGIRVKFANGTTGEYKSI